MGLALGYGRGLQFRQRLRRDVSLAQSIREIFRENGYSIISQGCETKLINEIDDGNFNNVIWNVSDLFYAEGYSTISQDCEFTLGAQIDYNQEEGNNPEYFNWSYADNEFNNATGYTLLSLQCEINLMTETLN